MRRGIKALMDCDGIVLLESSFKSKGATLEHYIATGLGMKVFYSVDDAIRNAK